MRLAYLELCGFRGFRKRLRIDFATGFTVISGRNGVGKSTLCDAVEFAITGEIGKYRVDKAAKETIGDYVWWRGLGEPDAHYVTVCFEDEGGSLFELTRTRKGGASLTPEQVESLLCEGASKPDLPLQQACRTTIIRDEWIAASSLDLTETERFELVRSSLGALDGPDYAAKARDVILALEKACKTAEAEYGDLRSRLTRALTETEQERTAAFEVGDLAAALSALGVASDGSVDVRRQVAKSRQELSDRRIHLGNLERFLPRWSELISLRAEAGSEAHKKRLETVARALADSEARFEKASKALEEAERLLAAEGQKDVLASSLASLIELGSSLGLHDGHCPLCDAARKSDEFAAGLEVARVRLATMGSGVEHARETYRVAVQAYEVADVSCREAHARSQEAASFAKDLDAREAALSGELAQVGIDVAATDPERLEAEIGKERSRLIDVERHVLTLDASRSVGRLTDLEQRVEISRKEADDAGDRLQRAQAALVSAKALERTVRRAGAEVIDERLAVISPLLNELYERLRPHSEWRNIEYAIRGDVKRFLSLKVGDNLNPQFVFSSGQRRAAGLAFLLSVHLARQWCRWTSLILDDPVQHIDDFRALHLVEVLGAMRRRGRQVVCAVEDVSLADLMCRRIPSMEEQPGRRIDLDLAADGEVVISRWVEIGPSTSSVLNAVGPAAAAG